jgi:hypothetical protein
MSFGQGGPQWGSGGGNDQEPYGRGQSPYGNRGQRDWDAFGSGGRTSSPGTPDWAALAEASAARARRKRWLMIGGGLAASLAVAGVVALAIVTSGDRTDDRASRSTGNELPGPAGPSATQAAPSFSSVAPPPPPNPRDFISDEKKDTAPLGVDSLFPGGKLTLADREYAKGSSARTASCAGAAQGSLGTILVNNGCDQVLRATYTKDTIAVTIGVAVFGTENEAKNAVARVNLRRDNITALPGGGVPVFCKGGPVCRFTANSYGRYAYFTTTGYTTAKSVTAGDDDAFKLGDDVAEFTFRQIVRRGEIQASAAAASPRG